mmetsp:Transcript_12587/g.26647  ORF Transcript_12587/g.26647 Transcript_12587/m.26647 type:complete len:230 (+) Transcript_12587:1086-1775(+)
MILIDLEHVVSKSFSWDVENKRPVNSIFGVRLTRRITRNAHGEVLRCEILLAPLLDEARDVVSVVHVLIPKVLDVGVITAIVQKPIRSDVSNDHQVHVCAIFDHGRVRFTYLYVGIIFPGDKIHFRATMDHSLHRIPSSHVHFYVASYDSFLTLLCIDIFAWTLSEATTDPLRIGCVATFPVLVQPIEGTTLVPINDIIESEFHGLRVNISTPRHWPHVRGTLGWGSGT